MKLIKVGHHYVPINLITKSIPKELKQAILLVLFIFMLGFSSGVGWGLRH